MILLFTVTAMISNLTNFMVFSMMSCEWLATESETEDSFFLASWGGVRLSPLGRSATNWPIVPVPDDIGGDECGSVCGIRIGRGKRSTQRKPDPMPLCPPQIPHDLGSNPGRCGGKPATNRLSYGKVKMVGYFTKRSATITQYTTLWDLKSSQWWLWSVLSSGK
jgi:hypothetical protein